MLLKGLLFIVMFQAVSVSSSSSSSSGSSSRRSSQSRNQPGPSYSNEIHNSVCTFLKLDMSVLQRRMKLIEKQHYNSTSELFNNFIDIRCCAPRSVFTGSISHHSSSPERPPQQVYVSSCYKAFQVHDSQKTIDHFDN